MGVGRRQPANLAQTRTSPAAGISYDNSGSFQKIGIIINVAEPHQGQERKQKGWQDTDTDLSLLEPPGSLLCFPKAI